MIAQICRWQDFLCLWYGAKFFNKRLEHYRFLAIELFEKNNMK